jgi:hypothetical protein
MLMRGSDCFVLVPDCSGRLRAFKEFLDVVFMVFFCALLVRFRSFAFIRKAREDRAARGSSLQRAPRPGPLLKRAGEAKGRNPYAEKLDLKTQRRIEEAPADEPLFSPKSV